MYRPRHFEETRPERLAALVRAHPFASVITVADGGPCAHALPLIRGADGVLRDHVARGDELACVGAPADCIAPQLRGIVGVQIGVERMRGKFKLSQNHPQANRLGVIDGPRRRRRGDDLALAELMQAVETEHGA